LGRAKAPNFLRNLSAGFPNGNSLVERLIQPLLAFRLSELIEVLRSTVGAQENLAMKRIKTNLEFDSVKAGVSEPAAGHRIVFGVRCIGDATPAGYWPAP
jgi:hypothetical protein